MQQRSRSARSETGDIPLQPPRTGADHNLNISAQNALHSCWSEALARARKVLAYDGPKPTIDFSHPGLGLRVRSYQGGFYEAPRVEIVLGRRLSLTDLSDSTREILLAHELGHHELWQSPRRFLYRSGILRGTVQEERDVNHIVYIAYTRAYGAAEAQRLIRRSISEFLDTQDGTSAANTDKHIERYSPALLATSPPRLWMGGAKWGRLWSSLLLGFSGYQLCEFPVCTPVCGFH